MKQILLALALITTPALVHAKCGEPDLMTAGRDFDSHQANFRIMGYAQDSQMENFRVFFQNQKTCRITERRMNVDQLWSEFGIGDELETGSVD